MDETQLNATAQEENPELLALLWDHLTVDRAHTGHGGTGESARRWTGYGTKTRAGLVASIKRVIADDWQNTRPRTAACGHCGHPIEYRNIDRGDPSILWCTACGAENMTLD